MTRATLSLDGQSGARRGQLFRPMTPHALVAIFGFCLLFRSGVAEESELEKKPEYGDSSYWVLLNEIRPSEGNLEPAFTPEGEEFELLVKNPHSRVLMLSLELNIEKYNLLFPPIITVNGEPLDYSPIRQISVKVPLNVTPDALEDMPVDVMVSDKEESGGFVLTRGKVSHTYHLKVSQPPDFPKMVLAKSIVVMDKNGKEIPSTPPFDMESDNVDYRFALGADDEVVTLQVNCVPQATGMNYDGVPAEPDSTLDIEVQGALTTTLAQCLYSHPRWTKGGTIQRTYVVSFSRDVELGTTPISVLMPQSQGYCEALYGDGKEVVAQWDPPSKKTPTEFLCRSRRETPQVIVLFNNPKVEMNLIDEQKVEHRVTNGLPVDVELPEGKRMHWTLQLEGGKNHREFPLTILSPASCYGGFLCPIGWSLKPRSQEEHLCRQEKCTKEDKLTCCDKGTSYKLLLHSFPTGKSRKPMVDVLADADMDRLQATQLLFGSDSKKLPIVLQEGVSGTEVSKLSAPLEDFGATVEVRPEFYYAFDVSLEDVGPNPDEVAKVVAKDGGISLDKAEETVKVPGTETLIGADLETAQRHVEQLEAANATVQVVGTDQEFGLTVTECPKKGCDDQRFLRALHKATGIPIDELKEGLKSLPYTLEERASSRMTAEFQEAVKKSGAVSKVEMAESEPHMKFMFRLNGVDPDELAKNPKLLDALYKKLIAEAAKKTGADPKSIKLQFAKPPVTVRVIVNPAPKEVSAVDVASAMAAGVGTLPGIAGVTAGEINATDVQSLVKSSQVASCGNFQCPEETVPRMHASSIECPSGECTEADTDRCCSKRVPCQETVCRIGYVKPYSEYPLFCPEPDCPDICCKKAPTCESHTCPAGWLPKSKEIAKITVCPGECSTEVCCNWESTCIHFRCPEDQIMKEKAENKLVSPLTAEGCCDPRDRCSSIQCHPGTTPVQDAEYIFCRTQQCSEEDATTCCEAAGTCYGYECPAHSVVRQQPQSLSCERQRCGPKDESTCCEKVATCGAFDCPARFVPKREAATIECKEAKCMPHDQDICCDEVATCSSFMCPLKPHPFGLRPHADFLDCKNATCTQEDDLETCCEEKQPCSAQECPEGMALLTTSRDLMVNKWELHRCCRKVAMCNSYSCPAGFQGKPGGHQISCGGPACEDSDAGACCEKAEEAPTLQVKDLRVSLTGSGDCGQDGCGKCEKLNCGRLDGFWCETTSDRVNLTAAFAVVSTETAKKVGQRTNSLGIVDVPSKGKLKHISAIIHERSIAATRINIYLEAKPDVPHIWDTCDSSTVRRLRGGSIGDDDHETLEVELIHVQGRNEDTAESIWL